MLNFRISGRIVVGDELDPCLLRSMGNKNLSSILKVWISKGSV